MLRYSRQLGLTGFSYWKRSGTGSHRSSSLQSVRWESNSGVKVTCIDRQSDISRVKRMTKEESSFKLQEDRKD